MCFDKETTGLAGLSKLEDSDISSTGLPGRSMTLGGRVRKGIENPYDRVKGERSTRHPRTCVIFT